MNSFWKSLTKLSELDKNFKVKCVVKPNQSAGTDSVYLCDSENEALNALRTIHGHANGIGQINDGALCQVK